jgi:hypothetical protein
MFKELLRAEISSRVEVIRRNRSNEILPFEQLECNPAEKVKLFLVSNNKIPVGRIKYDIHNEDWRQKQNKDEQVFHTHGFSVETFPNENVLFYSRSWRDLQTLKWQYQSNKIRAVGEALGYPESAIGAYEMYSRCRQNIPSNEERSFLFRHELPEGINREYVYLFIFHKFFRKHEGREVLTKAKNYLDFLEKYNPLLLEEYVQWCLQNEPWKSELGEEAIQKFNTRFYA